MAYRLKYSDYSTTASGPPDPARWIGPPGPSGPPGPQGTPGAPGSIGGGPINAQDAGADPTGAADSTSAIRTALATGKSVYLPAGRYYVTDSITVGAGNSSQRLFGDGESSIILVDTAFNPAASGVVILTGTQTPLASHPGVEHLCIQFAIPTDITATLSSASGTTLVLTAAVPAGVVVGDYVTDDTDWSGLQVNSGTMGTPTPVEGSKVTAISGSQVTLSLPVVAGHIAAGHVIRFAHPRSMLRNLGAAPGPSTGVGGYGARYPWAIVANDAGIPMIDDVLINGGWNGIQCHPNTGGGNFRITNCRIGVLNVGLNIDNGADGGFVDRLWYNAYGIYVPAQTSNTAFGQIYYDGQVVAMSLGRTDGCLFSNILPFQAKINVLTAWTFGQFVNITMDGSQSTFNIGSGAQEIIQITNLRCGAFTSSSSVILTNFRMDCGNRALPAIVIDNGSEARLIGGTIEWALPGAVVVRNSSTLRIAGVTFTNLPATNWSGGLVHATTGGAINVTACNFISGGIGPGLVIDNDSEFSSVLGNFWSRATFTPPGQLGKYQAGLPPEQGGIAAAGTTQGTATPLTAYYSNVTTVPVAGNGVMLPAWAPPGSRWVVWSNGANAMNVWPPVGYNIGAGTNVAVSLAPLTKGIWVAWDGTVFVREN